MNKAVEQYQKRFTSLKTEQQVWIPGYQDLQLINPTRGIFNNVRTGIGKTIDHKKLLRSYATHALRIFASGMNSGMTNKSSQWFKPTLDNIAYLEIPGVRAALDELQDKMYAIINQSNIYDVFYSSYEELGQFGTACYIILEDFDSVFRARSFTAGEYFLATDHKGKVNTFGRELEMTVAQLVDNFGLESCSPQVQANWKNGMLDAKVKCCHLIEPNDKRNEMYSDFKNMPFRSCYWEQGNHASGFLAMRGFKRFPVIAPRWEAVTTDMTYGYGPGHHSLGAVKELQVTAKDKLTVQAKIGRPPMLQDSSVMGYASLIPDGVTKVNNIVPNGGLRPAYQVPNNLDVFVQAISELREEIDRFFFVNLFQMMASIDSGKMTATEVAERQQEKMMMMGPALHKMDEEMLTPTLELIYGIMADNNLLPEFPPEVQGLTIKIEYTSILAQAQRALGVTKIERVLGIIGSVAPIFPNIVDNIDEDEVANMVNDLEGAPSKIIRSKEMVQAIRDQKAKQQQAMLAMEAAKTGADAANKLGNTPMGEDSALDRMTAGVGK